MERVSRTATDWIARTLADGVASTTSPTPQHGVRVIRMDEDNVAGSPAAGDETRAGIVVTGEFHAEGERLRFHVRVVDEARGGATWTIPPMLARMDSTEFVLNELSQRATGAVAALLDPVLAAWFPLATVPPTHAALVEFLRGQNASDLMEAARHYERAAELDTMLAWALLSAAQARMGFDPAGRRDPDRAGQRTRPAHSTRRPRTRIPHCHARRRSRDAASGDDGRRPARTLRIPGGPGGQRACAASPA
jgi:hypothetical protein